LPRSRHRDRRRLRSPYGSAACQRRPLKPLPRRRNITGMRARKNNRSYTASRRAAISASAPFCHAEMKRPVWLRFEAIGKRCKAFAPRRRQYRRREKKSRRCVPQGEPRVARLEAEISIERGYFRIVAARFKLPNRPSPSHEENQFAPLRHGLNIRLTAYQNSMVTCFALSIGSRHSVISIMKYQSCRRPTSRAVHRL